MPITAYLGSTASDYKNKSHILLRSLDIYCSNHPTERMVVHDKYPRTIKETGDQISVYRLICYQCKSTVAVLPDFLLPYKQFSAGEIEAVLIDSGSMSVYDIDTDASVYTVRLWLKSLRLELTDHGSHISLQTC